MPSRQPSDGLVLVDKPAGVTSHDVVQTARRALGQRRIGHAGTLDPFATGLLVLLTGRATRLLPYVDGEPKVYEATIRFGEERDTDDLTGSVTRTAPAPERPAIEAAIATLTGTIEQIPPAFSAKQVGGQRAYSAARRGAPLELEPVRVTVHTWTINALREQELDVTISCSGGTYIRALARDLGRLAGSAAHLVALRRISSGALDVKHACTIADLQSGQCEPGSPLAALGGVTVESLSDEDVGRVVRGIAVPARQAGPRAALIDRDGALVAMAERDADRWQPRAVLRDA